MTKNSEDIVELTLTKMAQSTSDSFHYIMATVGLGFKPESPYVMTIVKVWNRAHPDKKLPMPLRREEARR